MHIYRYLLYWDIEHHRRQVSDYSVALNTCHNKNMDVSPYTRGPEEGHEGDQRAETPLLQRQAGKVGDI